MVAACHWWWRSLRTRSCAVSLWSKVLPAAAGQILAAGLGLELEQVKSEHKSKLQSIYGALEEMEGKYLHEVEQNSQMNQQLQAYQSGGAEAAQGQCWPSRAHAKLAGAVDSKCAELLQFRETVERKIAETEDALQVWLAAQQKT